jgi:putative addiction module component (TIGR02574 family)
MLCRMTAKEHVLAEALRLRPSDRADLAAALLASLDEPEDAAAIAAWDAEVARRAAEIDSGRVQPLSAEEFALRFRDETD